MRLMALGSCTIVSMVSNLGLHAVPTRTYRRPHTFESWEVPSPTPPATTTHHPERKAVKEESAHRRKMWVKMWARKIGLTWLASTCRHNLRVRTHPTVKKELIHTPSSSLRAYEVMR
jgi:hypothetical protein